MSLYTYYCVNDFPNSKNVPIDYVEMHAYDAKKYIDDVVKWAFGEVGYIRVLTVEEEILYGLTRK